MPIPGPGELLIILVIVMLIFGAGKLTDIGKSLGQGIREFRNSVQDDPAASTPETSRTSAPPAVPTPAATTTPTAAVPGTAVASKCSRCGADLQAGQQFCPSCGQAVAS